MKVFINGSASEHTVSGNGTLNIDFIPLDPGMNLDVKVELYGTPNPMPGRLCDVLSDYVLNSVY